MATPNKPVLIPDEEEQEEDWPDLRPQNLEEAQKYVDQGNEIFDGLMDMLHDDRKDTIMKTV